MMNMNIPRNDLDGQPAALSSTPLKSSLETLGQSAEAVAHRAADTTRAQAGHLLDIGSARIREHPLQSMAVAAGAGAVLLLLLEMAMRVGRHSR